MIAFSSCYLCCCSSRELSKMLIRWWEILAVFYYYQIWTPEPLVSHNLSTALRPMFFILKSTHNFCLEFTSFGCWMKIVEHFLKARKKNPNKWTLRKGDFYNVFEGVDAEFWPYSSRRLISSKEPQLLQWKLICLALINKYWLRF